jgi:hypothetical protein
MILLCNIQIAKSQPGEMPNKEYYHRFIKTNYDKASAIKHIATLRSKLTDTLYLEQKSKDTLWLKAHKEALYLNFLCYDYQSELLNHDLCLKQLGIQNYQNFYKLRDLGDFPEKVEHELKYKQVKYIQGKICVDIYLKYNSNLKEMPASACGCIGALTELREDEEENAILNAKVINMKKAKEAEQNARQKQIHDSINRLKETIKYEPIYLVNGKLKSDSSKTIKSSNLDSLNIYLVREMLRSSHKVFSYYVNNCAGENIERMVDDMQIQKYVQLSWNIKLQKIKGTLTLINNIPINGISNSMLLKLISELFLNDIARFVDENEILVMPFKVFRNGTYTDNRTVEFHIEHGFLNIILPVIITDKDLTPYMSPEEQKQNRLEIERTRE